MTSVPTTTSIQDAQKKPWIIRFGVLLVGASVCMGGIGVAAYRYNEVSAADAASAAQVEQLHTQLNELKTMTGKSQEDVSVEATGMSPARKRSDDERMTDIMKQALTWSTGEQYIEARNALIERWKLDEGSQFLTVFMPGEDAGAWRTDSSGKTWFAYEGINSALESFTSSVTNVDGTNYTYFAVVGVKTVSSDGKASTVTYSTMSYTLDANGTVSGITGWAGSPGHDRTY